MDRLIPIVMKLQDAFNVINVRNQIDLPQIVVVGAQSTGKSSVLESIVGKDFLPRGQGIVTRCPLVLQLKRINKPAQPQQQMMQSQSHQQVEEVEYAEFLHRKGEKFYDFNKVRQEISDQTTRLAGNDKSISDEPISLTIYSPNVVDLTLVDLPGMTKVPIKGQPHDIEDQIKRMTYKQICQSNALILALTAANTDLANSDALKIAREVDPFGDRTIGVVTKIDLMDQGTDALDLLQGKIYPLKLGYFGVKCRSQKDIDTNVTIKQALIDEKNFFAGHHIYSSHCDKLGVGFMSEQLNKILCTHILKCIPSLSRQINEMLSSKEMELVQLDMNSLSVDGDKGPIILNMINRFTSSFGDMIEGRFVKESSTECLGGSRINYIFHRIFVKSIKEIDPFQYLTEQDIQTAIKNAQALTPSLFVPEVAFEVLIRQQIARLLEPSLECAHQVYKELRNIVSKIDIPEVRRFQKLKYKICDVMDTVLDKCLTPTSDMIIQLIEIENAHINTNHPDFIGSADSLLGMFASERDEQSSDKGSFDDKPKPVTLMEKSKSPNIGSKGSESFEGRQSNLDKNVNAKNAKKNLIEEEKVEQPSKESAGIFGYFFGGKQQQEKQKHNMNYSEMVENDEHPTGVDSVGNKLLRYDSMNSKKILPGRQLAQDKDGFEYLFQQNTDQLSYDKSNLPSINLPMIPQKMRASGQQENSRVIMETIIIQNLIGSYFAIVKKNIADLVPKTIMAFLVNESRNIAQRELVGDIYKLSNLDELMVEDPLVAQTREQRKKEIKALRTAQQCLTEAIQYKV